MPPKDGITVSRKYEEESHSIISVFGVGIGCGEAVVQS